MNFWLDGENLYVLDGSVGKIIPFSYSSGNSHKQEAIEVGNSLFEGFAKTKTGFVGLTGGGMERLWQFLNEEGK